MTLNKYKLYDYIFKIKLLKFILIYFILLFRVKLAIDIRTKK